MDHNISYTKLCLDVLADVDHEDKEKLIQTITHRDESYAKIVYSMLTAKNEEQYEAISKNLYDYHKQYYLETKQLISRLGKTYREVEEEIEKLIDQDDLNSLNKQLSNL